MYKAFIWDFDGTLYNTYPAMVKAAKRTLAEFGHHLSEKEIYYVMKKDSTKTLHERLGISAEEFNPPFHQYEAEESAVSKSFAETKEVLQAIQLAGGKNYILTHRVTASTWSLLKEEGMEQLVEDIVGIDMDFPRKPNPTSLNYLIEKHQLNKKETMMLGDRRLDIEAGINAGVDTCLYDIDHFLGEIPATYVVDDLRQVLPLMSK
ncbi:MAG: HAD-IA family hydrolase [Enterococcus sp.]